MNGTKSPLASIGIMGPALTLLVYIVNKFVVKADVITENDLTLLIDQGAIIVGTILAVYGRYRATKEIK